MRISMVTFCLALIFSACGVRVKSAYDHQQEFGGYKTFCWMKGCEFEYTGPSYVMTPQVKSMLQNAVIAEMKKKGISYDDNNPQLLLDLHITVQDEKAYVYSHGNDNEWLSRFYNQSPPQEIILLKGTVVLDIADKNSGRMIWRSVARAYMDIHPDLTQQNIDRAIAALLKDFPPHSK